MHCVAVLLLHLIAMNKMSTGSGGHSQRARNNCNCNSGSDSDGLESFANK